MRSFRWCYMAFVLIGASAQAQWIQTSLDSVTVTALFANDAVVIAGTDDSGVFRSTDHGATWSPFNAGLPESTVVYKFTAIGTSILVGKGGRIYRTTSLAAGWTSSHTGLVDTMQVYAFGRGDSELYASVVGGIYRSLDSGRTWTKRSADQGISCMVVLPTGVLAGTNGGSLLRSTDNGTNWSAFGSGAATMITYDLAVMGPRILLGTYDGAFVSTDQGATWNAANAGLTNPQVRRLILDGRHLFAGTANGIFASSDSGAAWSDITSPGLITTSTFALASDGAYLYSGEGSGVWRRPLSEVVTAMAEAPADIPSSVVLDQNYPNPFNPTTTIRYAIPRNGMVRLTICDLLGREVQTLVSEIQSAGWKEVRWDASGLPSGAYLYRLQTPDIVETKKLILMK